MEVRGMLACEYNVLKCVHLFVACAVESWHVPSHADLASGIQLVSLHLLQFHACCAYFFIETKNHGILNTYVMLWKFVLYLICGHVSFSFLILLISAFFHFSRCLVRDLLVCSQHTKEFFFHFLCFISVLSVFSISFISALNLYLCTFYLNLFCGCHFTFQALLS